MEKFIEMDCLTSDEEIKTLALFSIICKHFKEELQTIFLSYPAGTTSFELSDDGPLIATIENENDSPEYYAILDKNIIHQPNNCIEALQILMAIWDKSKIKRCDCQVYILAIELKVYILAIELK
ncbi:hypothetical protein TSAR_015192, partial [Trichomalopsis sarcophagae]